MINSIGNEFVNSKSSVELPMIKRLYNAVKICEIAEMASGKKTFSTLRPARLNPTYWISGSDKSNYVDGTVVAQV